MFFEDNSDWSRRCETIASRLTHTFTDRGLRAENFGFVALRQKGANERPDGFSYRGDWRCYPCSLVKAFHLVHVLNAIDRGTVADHAELSRAMRDMILWSSNTATNYVIDIITGTTGDTLLEGGQFDEWRGKREQLNHFFSQLDWPEFEACNISQKLMDDVRYGREAQYAGRGGENLNALTPLAAARLFSALFSSEAPLSASSEKRAQQILLRDRSSAEAKQPHFQVEEFLGGGIPADAQIWSKAGKNTWTGDPNASYYKHDLIRVAIPGSAPVIVCLMTQGKEICEEFPEAFPAIGKLMFETLLNN
ncbi:serine hydrolase [Ochrobactrum sp. BTU1]|uniref:serine hydrolase n=1 Tax=Ochrobactrum sp. BTU1 TaxID=2840456 RepID=UPI001C0572D4|nr:class A beta-lactamase-related serine hydrolase [Ochrobactrum sp. BTU1]